jgi:hypothetical protein
MNYDKGDIRKITDGMPTEFTSSTLSRHAMMSDHLQRLGLGEEKVMSNAFEEEILKGDNQANYPDKARAIVDDYIQKAMFGVGGTPYETYVVWFSKTLQNWKAMVSTTMPDRMYYEVTYNGDLHEYYLDVYAKTQNVIIPGEGKKTS